jgi:hypothetical protein
MTYTHLTFAPFGGILMAGRTQIEGRKPRMEEDLQEQTNHTDMVGDLREQVIQAEDAFEAERKARLAESFLGLEPWQRLVLAVLLFLNVAMCGCMALVMTGRVVLPF